MATVRCRRDWAMLFIFGVDFRPSTTGELLLQKKERIDIGG